MPIDDAMVPSIETILERLGPPEGKLRRLANEFQPGPRAFVQLLQPWIGANDFRLEYLRPGRSGCEVVVVARPRMTARVIKCGPVEKISSEASAFDTNVSEQFPQYFSRVAGKPFAIENGYGSIAYTWASGLGPVETLYDAFATQSPESLCETLSKLSETLFKWYALRTPASARLIDGFPWSQDAKNRIRSIVSSDFLSQKETISNFLDEGMLEQLRLPVLHQHGSSGRCHGDLNPGNILVQNNGSQGLESHLIDWADIKTGQCPAYDWAKLERDIKIFCLRDACPVSEYPVRLKSVENFLAHSDSVLPTQDAERRCAMLCAFIRHSYVNGARPFSDAPVLEYLYYLSCWATVLLLDPRLIEEERSVQETWVRTAESTILNLHRAFKKVNTDLSSIFSYVSLGRNEPVTVVQNIIRKLPAAPGLIRLAEDYMEFFAGRVRELEELNQFVQNPNKNRLLVLAPSGRGKTALLAHWAQQLYSSREWSVVFHAVSRRYQTADKSTSLQNITGHLAIFFGLEADALDSAFRQPAQALADLLRRPMPNGKKLILIIDGIDECDGWQFDRLFLPKNLPANLKLVISSRLVGTRTNAMVLDQLGWSANETTILNLQPLSKYDIALLIQQLGLPAELTAHISADEIYHISEGDPLTARHLLEVLRDRMLEREEAHITAQGLHALITNWLEDIEQAISRDNRLYQLMALLSCALGPLEDGDILSLLPSVFRHHIDIKNVVRSVGRFIRGNGSADSGYILDHPRVPELFRVRLSEAERVSFDRLFVTYGLNSWRTMRIVSAETPPRYVRQFWVRHLKAAELWDTVEPILLNFERRGDSLIQPWYSSRCQIESKSNGYMQDLVVLRDHSIATASPQLSFRCSLATTSVRTPRLGFIAPFELITDLATIGTSDGTPTARQILTMLNGLALWNHRLSALDELLQRNYIFAPSEAIEFLNNLEYLAWHWGIAKLLPVIRSPFLYDALDRCALIPEAGSRARALAEFLPYLDGELKAVVFQEIARDAPRVRSLATSFSCYLNLARYSSSDSADVYWRQALVKATKMNAGDRWASLLALIPGMPIALLPQVLPATTALDKSIWQATILASLVERSAVSYERLWSCFQRALTEDFSSRFEDQIVTIAMQLYKDAGYGDLLATIANNISPFMAALLKIAASSAGATGNHSRQDIIDLTRMCNSVEERKRLWSELLKRAPDRDKRDLSILALDDLKLDIPQDLTPWLTTDGITGILGVLSAIPITTSNASIVLHLARRFDIQMHRTVLERVIQLYGLSASSAQVPLVVALGNLEADRNSLATRAVEITVSLALQERAEQSYSAGVSQPVTLASLRIANWNQVNTAGDSSLGLFIAAIAPFLSKSSLQKAAAIVAHLSNRGCRAEAAVAVYNLLDASELVALWETLLPSLKIDEKITILSHLPVSLVKALKREMLDSQSKDAVEAYAKYLAVTEQISAWELIREKAKAILLEVPFSSDGLNMLGHALWRLHGLGVSVNNNWSELFHTLSVGGAKGEESLVTLSQFLPEDMMRQAIEISGGFVNLKRKAAFLRTVAERAPKALIKLLHKPRSLRSDSFLQLNIYAGLAANRCVNPEMIPWSSILELLEKTWNDGLKKEVLSTAGRYVPSRFVSRALAIARGINFESHRFAALLAFDKYITAETIYELLYCAFNDPNADKDLIDNIAKVVPYLTAVHKADPGFATESPLLWHSLIHAARWDRSSLFRLFTTLMPWFNCFMGTTDFDQLLDFAIQVVDVWPQAYCPPEITRRVRVDFDYYPIKKTLF